MSLTFKASEFSYEINKLLGQYQRGLYTQLEPVFKKTGNELRKELRANSPKKTGHYKGGWQQKVQMSSRVGGGTLTIYNGSRPWLTHLLEHGHVIRNGTERSFGRTNEYPHIEQVNDKAGEIFEKYLMMALGEIEVKFT